MVAEVIGVKPVKVGLGHRPGVIGKTEMTIFAEDDVIEQSDPKDVHSLAKPLREHSVFQTGWGSPDGCLWAQMKAELVRLMFKKNCLSHKVLAGAPLKAVGICGRQWERKSDEIRGPRFSAPEGTRNSVR